MYVTSNVPQNRSYRRLSIRISMENNSKVRFSFSPETNHNNHLISRGLRFYRGLTESSLIEESLRDICNYTQLVSLQCTIVTSAFPIAKKLEELSSLTFGHSKLMADKLAKCPGFNCSLVKASSHKLWNLRGICNCIPLVKVPH